MLSATKETTDHDCSVDQRQRDCRDYPLFVGVSMKPALYFSIVQSYDRFKVVAITTEKNRRWFGRTLPDASPTNGAISQLNGRFADCHTAYASVEKLRQVYNSHIPAIEAAEKLACDARKAQRDEIKALLIFIGAAR